MQGHDASFRIQMLLKVESVVMGKNKLNVCWNRGWVEQNIVTQTLYVGRC